MTILSRGQCALSFLWYIPTVLLRYLLNPSHLVNMCPLTRDDRAEVAAHESAGLSEDYGVDSGLIVAFCGQLRTKPSLDWAKLDGDMMGK